MENGLRSLKYKRGFCNWPRNLATNCGRKHGKLLALESDIPEFESWLHGILAM